MSRDPVSRARCLAVSVGGTLAAALLLAWLLPHLALGASAPPPVERFDAWLVLGCEAAAAVGVAWLWLLVCLVSLEAAGTTSPRRRGVPAGVRRAVLAACGAGLTGGLLAPAYAASPSPLDGLPLPDRPASVVPVTWPAQAAGPAPTADPPRGAGRPARTVRVRPGDTLWAIAVLDLPAGASDARVDTRWRAIHAANREVIGGDPDLVRPGQRLRLPPSVPSRPPG